MRRLSGISIGLVLVGVLLGAASTATATVVLRTPWIGASTVELTQDNIIFGNTLRAFIRTGSSSPVCLATIADENVGAAINSKAPITTVCSARTWNGGGVVLTVWVGSEDLPTDVPFVIDYTIYQQGARGYAAPVPYPGD